MSLAQKLYKHESTTPDQWWFLENVNLVDFFCPNSMTMVREDVPEDIRKEFQKGDFIFRPQDSVDQVFLLQSGRVKVGSYSEEGKEIIKAILQPGELFGEMGLLGEEQRGEFAMAMEDDVRVCVMRLDTLQTLMKENAGFGLKVTRIVGQKLRRMERRLESLVFKDARTRIIDFLLELAEESGRKVGDETLIEGVLTHKDMASLTATSRQTVTSVLNDLRDNNQIYFDRKRMLIRDVNTLK